MNGDPSTGDPDFFDKVLQKELDNFDLFEAVTAGAAIRRTKYCPGQSGRRYPSKITIYGAVPVTNEYRMEDEEPVSGLVLSKREIVPDGRMFEGLFYGEAYFDGQSDRVVEPCLTIISSMLPENAKVVNQIKRPAIQITTDLEGIQERVVQDPFFALDDRAELELLQGCYADWLGMLALRLPK